MIKSKKQLVGNQKEFLQYVLSTYHLSGYEIRLLREIIKDECYLQKHQKQLNTWRDDFINMFKNSTTHTFKI